MTDIKMKGPTDPANSWQTPIEIINALGRFDLDPCAAPSAPDRCALIGYCGINDGLYLPWFGRVFCNPPYGRFSRPWLEKCAEHGNAIALVTPKSIGARWFQSLLKGTTVLFLQGRVPFIDSISGEPAAANTQWSCLIAWGENNRAVLHECSILGLRVDPR